MSSEVEVLVITGPVGVGKSSAADAISEILRKQGISHAIIDMDYLRCAFPRPKNDPFHQALGAKNLADLWKNYQEIGTPKIIIPNVVESQADVDTIAKAIPEAKITVIRLSAGLDTVHERLHERHGKRDTENLNWHLNRAIELANQLENASVEDAVIDTEDKSIITVANEILEKWQG